ncbi:protein of unknown function DUF1624 [Solidesulfovibrio carbinoliphilus subsp. oakridgensis]|uniref:Heparan-alpha-glucosaminide N-acetyltransferase catalytic domain-containing protein n=1 Tax=Solidesulfovibrio carbinoliphilus subsp. oakridgensis TaxID=694327 RepID=G7Q8D5_9BACT|nr:heparan-alpha-glucosaminide N-acetyltransferase domain-containing protein [Solidesulfovibrio carbinoliphilus]EHJ48547.1 protein of unknown function DUF1624 [Solidesulfovibrio carbinoliphilus subsp. oakridgensis]
MDVKPVTAARPASARMTALDTFRGLIMVLMALDHASYFVAGVHPTELWSRPLPRYDAVLPFVTRLASHLCAPGFFLLMGVGMALFAGSRKRAGWTLPQIVLHLALRGVLLVCLQFLAENPAWSLFDSGTWRLTPYFGVLYGLGATMLVWSPLVGMSSVLVLGLSLAAIAATQFLVPLPAGLPGAGSLWAGVLLVPGKAGPGYVFYPLVPWLGVAGLGLCLGRRLRRDAGGAGRLLLVAGILALAAFLLARLAGMGDFHRPAGTGFMALLAVTKYPPSVDFLLLTLGADAVVLGGLLLAATGTGGRAEAGGAGGGGWGLAVFGRTPLFFYLVHLYVYALVGLALPLPTTIAEMYPFWLLGLAVLYPLCVLYGRLKAGLPSTSLWRML